MAWAGWAPQARPGKKKGLRAKIEEEKSFSFFFSEAFSFHEFDEYLNEFE
jgi:hypothetical protein